jgi:hypothetical protein
LAGTVAGTTIVDVDSAANVNIVVKADSVLKNSDATLDTIKSTAGNNNFVISGDKNLTIDGKITVTNPATDRLDATDALNHPWFQKAIRGDYDHLTLDDALLSLKTFHAGSRLKQAMHTFFVKNLLTETEINALEQ